MHRMTAPLSDWLLNHQRQVLQKSITTARRPRGGTGPELAEVRRSNHVIRVRGGRQTWKVLFWDRYPGLIRFRLPGQGGPSTLLTIHLQQWGRGWKSGGHAALVINGDLLGSYQAQWALHAAQGVSYSGKWVSGLGSHGAGLERQGGEGRGIVSKLLKSRAFCTLHTVT